MHFKKIFTVVFLIVFFSLFYAAGIFFTWMGWNAVQLGREAQTWPVAVAELKQCVVESRPSKGGRVYHAAATYSYSVAGKDYVGDRMEIDYWSSSNQEKYAALCQKVGSMKPFVIRYRPGQPDLSVVLPPDHPWRTSSFIFGVVWLVFITCFVALILAMHGARRNIVTSSGSVR
jgi:hypothetical protein